MAEHRTVDAVVVGSTPIWHPEQISLQISQAYLFLEKTPILH
jgi:hypothetical protein